MQLKSVKFKIREKVRGPLGDQVREQVPNNPIYHHYWLGAGGQVRSIQAAIFDEVEGTLWEELNFNG